MLVVVLVVARVVEVGETDELLEEDVKSVAVLLELLESSGARAPAMMVEFEVKMNDSLLTAPPTAPVSPLA